MATLLEVAGWVGAEASATGAIVSRVSSIEDAEADCVVFATDAGTLQRALEARAGIVLATVKLRDEDKAGDSRVLWVKDARYGFALVADKLRRRIGEGVVHASAVLGAGVTVGVGTSVGAGVFVENGVLIGEYCDLGPRVTVYAGTVLGNRVTVQAGAVLGSAGFGYARNAASGEYLLFPQQGTLVIEDDVEIGANTTIDRGALGETRIGRGTKIDNLVHIGHNCVIGKNVIIAAQTGISGSSVVEDGAILGGQVGIGEHATVGAGVILGGGAGVLSGKKMRGPGEVFWGRPARPLKEYLRDLARLKKR
jgi:UDP-3-O-[3-hydroxymyristoyl] glucosamine N-acyltransferase